MILELRWLAVAEDIFQRQPHESCSYNDDIDTLSLGYGVLYSFLLFADEPL